ncbi:uncharacterized protein LOC127473319 isoform X2 [Manacus candei]|uniref:uncharacterized protein LOC127473319 isoform X2 n=1 Tax=Manacus candei TaxID=415023 RepID=UPI0022260297|nr:uncharacterized protein LOC127473319 isoform X2 [Manacus candei]
MAVSHPGSRGCCWCDRESPWELLCDPELCGFPQMVELPLCPCAELQLQGLSDIVGYGGIASVHVLSSGCRGLSGWKSPGARGARKHWSVCPAKAASVELQTPADCPRRDSPGALPSAGSVRSRRECGSGASAGRRQLGAGGAGLG